MIEIQRLDEGHNVYRMKLRSSTTARLVDLLPAAPARLLRLAFDALVATCPPIRATRPEWFLPNTIIVKKVKPGWEDEFQQEKRVYDRLRPLHGTLVPHYYGEALYDGLPVIMLSEIHGQTFWDLAQIRDIEPLPELERKVQSAFRALHDHGVSHGDSTLTNILYTGSRVMLIDFEFSALDDSDGLRTEWQYKYCYSKQIWKDFCKVRQARANANWDPRAELVTVQWVGKGLHTFG